MKARKLGGFDIIAPVYDVLASLVFGKSIRNAQLHYLSEIRDGSRVLILGGGTGWLLAELLRINPDCQVWYIEASAKMLEKARKKIATLPRACVHFIHGTEEQLPLHVGYDAVITNFYFDLFSSSSLVKPMKNIGKSFLPSGKLLVSDFTETNLWWQSAMLSAMYLFFRWVSGIEATQLPDWQHQLRNLNFDCKKSRCFYGNFIKSSVYEFYSRDTEYGAG